MMTGGRAVTKPYYALWRHNKGRRRHISLTGDVTRRGHSLSAWDRSARPTEVTSAWYRPTYRQTRTKRTRRRRLPGNSPPAFESQTAAPAPTTSIDPQPRRGGRGSLGHGQGSVRNPHGNRAYSHSTYPASDRDRGGLAAAFGPCSGRRRQRCPQARQGIPDPHHFPAPPPPPPPRRVGGGGGRFGRRTVGHLASCQRAAGTAREVDCWTDDRQTTVVATRWGNCFCLPCSVLHSKELKEL